MKDYLLIFAGGGLGSVLRYTIGRLATTAFPGALHFPLGTFLANLAACVLVALAFTFASGFSKQHAWYPFLVIGICGGLSTFSAFSLENVQLLRNGQVAWFLFNVVASILMGIAVIYPAVRK